MLRGGGHLEPIFFATPEDFRVWLRAHHVTTEVLLVGFHKKGSGLPSITWPEAVDEALCVGWIDGVRKRLNETSYTIRFTPRKPRSTWSTVNIARVAALTTEGRMQPAGLAAFARRAAERSEIYAYEQQADPTLTAEEDALFRANPAAWDFFCARPPSYRHPALWWIVSAKRPATRQRRLAILIADSAAGHTLAHLTRVK